MGVFSVANEDGVRGGPSATAMPALPDPLHRRKWRAGAGGCEALDHPRRRRLDRADHPAPLAAARSAPAPARTTYILGDTAVKLPALAAIVVPAAVGLAACLLDLGDLTGGIKDGGAGEGAGGDGTSGGSTGGAGVLDCAPCPDAGCAAQVIASGPDTRTPGGIAVTGDGVYWVNQAGNTVMRLSASGGAPQVLATANAPTSIAVAGDYAVWAAQDGVFGCTVTSCAQSLVEIVAPTLSGSIQGVAYDGQYVYFTDQGTGAADGTVGRCPPLAGCPTPVNLGDGLNLPLGITRSGTLVFWTEVADGNQNGAVFKSPAGGGGQSQISASLDLPTAVVADATYAYWTQSTPTGGTVSRCVYGPGYCMTVENLAGGLAEPLDLALGGGRIYWTDSGDGQVLSCPSSGCGTAAPRQHASGRVGLRRIALGASCVFWTDDQGGGSVSKVAR